MEHPSMVKQFEDFDGDATFQRLSKRVAAADSNNFVLDFDEQHAKCAFDLGSLDIKELLSHRKSRMENDYKPPTRWINIWKPEQQKDTIEIIARHYGFSPRLRLSMVSTPGTPNSVGPQISPRRARYERFARVHRKSRDHGTEMRPSVDGDLEMARYTKDPAARVLNISHYRIINQVWHFASVDWGFKFTCIGFNSLYTRPEESLTLEEQETDTPAGKRVWTWLVLCNDKTVISIHENPFPQQESSDEDVLRAIRLNLKNVFMQLSKANQQRNPIMTVNIRPGLHELEGDEAQVSEESVPSLLFYYLFDDWFTTYALVSRDEHKYSQYLQDVRNDMFSLPDIDNSRRLHHLGRQLALLKRMYQSYIMLIDRVLKGPHSGKQVAHSFLAETEAKAEDTMKSTKTGYGVAVSTAAAVRFERLRDRIELYALSEIQDCLDEKEDLVMLTFNLVALKESSYVERLTRITILLAKGTILFLPVSLMSAYFAIPIVGYGDSYTLTDYWASFAIVFGLSIIGLVVFGYLSGTQEGRPIYKSFTRAGYEISRRFFSREGKGRAKEN